MNGRLWRSAVASSNRSVQDARLVGVELDEHVAARTQELSDPAKEDDGVRADPDVAVEQQRGLPSR